MHKPWHQRSMMKYNVGGPVSQRRQRRNLPRVKSPVTINEEKRLPSLIPNKRGRSVGVDENLIKYLKKQIKDIPVNELPLGEDIGGTTPMRRFLNHPQFVHNRRKNTPQGKALSGLIKEQERLNLLADFEKQLEFEKNPERKNILRKKINELKNSGVGGLINARNFDIKKGIERDPAKLLGIETPSIELPQFDTSGQRIQKEIDNANTQSVDIDLESVIPTASGEEVDQTEVAETTESDPSPTPEEPQEETVEDFIERMSRESFIERSPEYRPEAIRAGNVAQMYGEIAPGQVGGFGVGLSRGARTAELRQQGIEDKEREYEKERAIEMAKLAAEPAYGDLADLTVGQLGGKNIIAQIYKSKRPGSYNSKFAEGQAANVIQVVDEGTRTLNRYLKAIDALSANAELATGGLPQLQKLAAQMGTLFNLKPSASNMQSQEAIVDFLQLELAKELLGEGGKTISDTERQMVKDALGQPGTLTSPDVLKRRLKEVKLKLLSSRDAHKRFLNNAAEKFPDIAAELSRRNETVKKSDYMGN